MTMKSIFRLILIALVILGIACAIQAINIKPGSYGADLDAKLKELIES